MVISVFTLVLAVHSRRVVRENAVCVCTTLADYESVGVDVRPYVGCLEESYCYVQFPCAGAVGSERFAGAVYAGCAASSPPPPTPSACEDPYFAAQWHLPAARVPEAWTESGQRDFGGGETLLGGHSASTPSLVVVDDGVDLAHPDLRVDEYVAWTTDGTLVSQPAVSVDVTHGTAVAGVAAALADNGRGGCGVAPGVRLATAALLSAPSAEVADVAEAESITHFLAHADVYTNSWGPPDDPTYPVVLGQGYVQALDLARTQGRGGKGSVVLFAAGNGGRADNANDDPYAAHRYTVAVGAVGDDDKRTYYSESGACILLCGPSSGGLRGVVTTDATDGGYAPTQNITFNFGGTSSSTPVVAGVVLLLLRERPDMGWRDVHALLARGARINDPRDPAWTVNGAGRRIHPYYGFGVVDAAKTLRLARSWSPLPEEKVMNGVVIASGSGHRPTDIPDDGTPWRLYWRVGDEQKNESPSFVVETVEVWANLTHPWRGDLRLILTSPSGTRVPLTTPFASVPSTGKAAPTTVPFVPRTYTAVGFADERGRGVWTLTVQDVHPTQAGRVNEVRLVLYGHEREAGGHDNRSSSVVHECATLRNEYQAADCCVQ